MSSLPSVAHKHLANNFRTLGKQKHLVKKTRGYAEGGTKQTTYFP